MVHFDFAVLPALRFASAVAGYEDDQQNEPLSNYQVEPSVVGR